MELMRHSDRKLTDKIYADSNLLPLGEVVRNLPDEEPLTNILTNISGKTCRNGSRVGEIEPLEKAAQTALNAASRLRLSQSGDSETLVEVAGIEPVGAGEGTPVNKGNSDCPPEALIKILTNLSDSDRRMLSQIVERYNGGQGGTGLSRKGEVRGSKDAGPVSQPAKPVVA
jgi:hypothetical protein